MSQKKYYEVEYQLDSNDKDKLKSILYTKKETIKEALLAEVFGEWSALYPDPKIKNITEINYYDFEVVAKIERKQRVTFAGKNEAEARRRAEEQGERTMNSSEFWNSERCTIQAEVIQ